MSCCPYTIACFQLILNCPVTNFTLFDNVKEQSSVDNIESKSKRSQTLSEGEKTADHGISPAATSETHDKGDDDEEDNGKRKVQMEFYEQLCQWGYNFK